jgi:hypothetical protein
MALETKMRESTRKNLPSGAVFTEAVYIKEAKSARARRRSPYGKRPGAPESWGIGFDTTSGELAPALPQAARRARFPRRISPEPGGLRNPKSRHRPF